MARSPEERVAYLVAAPFIAESHREIPLAVRGVAHLLAVRNGDGGRYASLLQVMEQRPVLQGKHLHILETVPVGTVRINGFLRSIVLCRHTRHFRHYLACVRKSPVLMNSPANAKMLPPLPSPKSNQRFFSGFTLKEGVCSSL